MKESTSTEEDWHSMPNEEEIEVADILVNLANIIAKFESRSQFPLTWGAKKRLAWGVTRRRSRPSSENIAAAASSPQPSPSLQGTWKNDCNEETKRNCGEVKLEATSPATPLSFLPSESDDKSNNCHKRNSKKRTRDELLETIEGLTERRDLLQREIEKVRGYYDQLFAYNRELKTVKQRVKSTNTCHKREEPEARSFGPSIGHCYQISATAHHQQPFIMMNPMVAEAQARREQQFHYSYNNSPVTLPLFSSNNGGLGKANHVGPLGIDLNISAEEICWVDSSHQQWDYSNNGDRRARFAEARRNRKMNMKMKGEKKCVQLSMKPPRSS